MTKTLWTLAIVALAGLIAGALSAHECAPDDEACNALVCAQLFATFDEVVARLEAGECFDPSPPSPCHDCDAHVFSDGLESGDLSAWEVLLHPHPTAP